jgi:hypothetical protein
MVLLRSWRPLQRQLFRTGTRAPLACRNASFPRILARLETTSESTTSPQIRHTSAWNRFTDLLSLSSIQSIRPPHRWQCISPPFLILVGAPPTAVSHVSLSPGISNRGSGATGYRPSVSTKAITAQLANRHSRGNAGRLPRTSRTSTILSGRSRSLH